MLGKILFCDTIVVSRFKRTRQKWGVKFELSKKQLQQNILSGRILNRANNLQVYLVSWRTKLDRGEGFGSQRFDLVDPVLNLHLSLPLLLYQYCVDLWMQVFQVADYM